MEPNLELRQITDEKGMEQFWTLRDQYMNEDIIPNCDPPLSDEDKEWFFSAEYREHIMGLFRRKTDILRAAYFMRNGVYAGFVAYVVYGSEDGKCFIIEYCISANLRGSGLGAQFFAKLEDAAKLEHATYFALNASNKRNKKFWESLGFVEGEIDEHGTQIYTRGIN